MEATKLDKAVDKLFRFVEKHTRFLFKQRDQAVARRLSVRLFAIAFILQVCVIAINVYFRGWEGLFTTALIMAMIYLPYLIKYREYLRPQNVTLWLPQNLNLLGISVRIFPSAIVDGCFRPLVGDWRQEYYEAKAKGDYFRAVTINCRYFYAFGVMTVRQLLRNWL